MQLRQFVQLEKKIDEHECNLVCTPQASLEFISQSLDAFKVYVHSRIEEETAKRAKESASAPENVSIPESAPECCEKAE